MEATEIYPHGGIFEGSRKDILYSFSIDNTYCRYASESTGTNITRSGTYAVLILDGCLILLRMQCRQHICVPRIDHVHKARETNDYRHIYNYIKNLTFCNRHTLRNYATAEGISLRYGWRFMKVAEVAEGL
jgi:hypothetical protein